MLGVAACSLHYKSNLGLVFCELFQHLHHYSYWFAKILRQARHVASVGLISVWSLKLVIRQSFFANAIFFWFVKVLRRQRFMIYGIYSPTALYSTALMQRRTTLFLVFTGLLERSTFSILEKIARVANDTRSRSFHEYRLLDRLRFMANRIAMDATLPFY